MTLDHINMTKRDVDSLTVFWKSAGAADDDDALPAAFFFCEFDVEHLVSSAVTKL